MPIDLLAPLPAGVPERSGPVLHGEAPTGDVQRDLRLRQGKYSIEEDFRVIAARWQAVIVAAIADALVASMSQRWRTAFQQVTATIGNIAGPVLVLAHSGHKMTS